MFQRRILVLLSAVILFSGGCVGGIVNREELEATARIAVVSVVIPRDGRKANSAVLQETVNHARERVQAGLKGIRPWKVLDPSDDKAGKTALSSFGETSRADLAAVFPRPPEQDHAKETIGAELTAWKEQFIGAAGLLVIPREALLPDEESTQKDETVRPLARYLAGKLCKDLQVDAVAFVHVRYAITHPRENAFIVTDDRTDGLLAMSATLVAVDKSGKIILDTGLRPADETSRRRDLLPIFRGSGKDAVKPQNIDLADPKKKVRRAFTELAEESVNDLMESLKEALRK